MYKFSRWLWNKAERVTAQHILGLMESYWVMPVHPGDKATERQAIMFERQYQSWKDSRTVMDMIMRRYFPERTKDAPR